MSQHLPLHVLHLAILAMPLAAVPLHAKDTFADSAVALHPDTVAQRTYPAFSAGEAETSPLLSVLPPSPQASALARYGEYPVSHATGVPDITIPLYEIRLGGFTLPISLSYHASGIKADEVATSVGLGWTLNAGGAIVRQVCGGPDLAGANNEYYDYGKVVELRDRVVTEGLGSTVLNALLHGNGSSTFPFLYDTASDRYTFNFAGKGGMFRYSYRDSVFVPTTYSSMRIYGDTDIEGGLFVITDTDGTVYVFSEQEHCGARDDENQTSVSAWYLSEIRTPFGDISIAYENSSDYVMASNTEYVVTGTFGKTRYVGVSPLSDGYVYTESDESRYFVSQAEILYRIPVVSAISWRGGKIHFNYSDDRCDMWKTRLRSIIVSDNAGNTVKAITLGNDSYWGGTERNKRMMLRKLHVSDVGTYRFDYDTSRGLLPDYAAVVHGNNFSIGGLPCHTDYWGYFNGSDSRCSIPKELYRQVLLKYGNIQEDKKLSLSMFADRTPNIRYSTLGTLTRITYPTGGSTCFEYEANDYGFGGLRVKSIEADGTKKSFRYNSARQMADHPVETMAYNAFHFLGNNPVAYGTKRLQGNVVCVGTPQLPLNSSCVFYTDVDEMFENGDKTNYRYTCHPEPDALCGMTTTAAVPQMSFAHLNDYGNLRPLLLERTWFNPDGMAIRKESYTYRNIQVRKFSAGVKIEPRMWYAPTYDNSVFPRLPDAPGILDRNSILVDSVTVHSTVCELVEKETVDHVAGVTTTERLRYDDLHRTGLPKSVTVANSDGREHTTEYKFAFDVDEPLCRRMIEDFNMYDAVAKKTESCDGNILSEAITEYGESHGWPRKKSAGLSLLGNTPYERFRFCDYDSHGNLTRLVTDGTDTDSIVWGYNGMHPVAHFHNGTPQREYAWKPLVGLSSVRDPNGYLREYGYDAAGRLSSVGDASGTAQEYSYRYVHGPGGETSGSNSVQAVAFLSPDKTHKTSTLQYCDGLGRPFDKSDDSASEDGTFLHSVCSYDARGRQSRQWLPIVSSEGEPVGKDKARELSRDTYGDTMAYSDTEYDAADRPVYTSTAGEAWRGKGKAVERIGNGERDVRLFHAPLDRVSLVDDGYYKTATLFGERTTDEDGHSLTTFTDRLGRKVLERRNDGKANNDTYFVYNDLGQLRYVLSPEYQHSGYKDKYAYEYRYDGRGNVVKRILPGCEYTQYWYDRANRMSFMQDATLRERGRYRFFLYDRLGRLAVQGTCATCDRGERPNVAEFSEKDGGICNTSYKVPLSDKITNPNLEMVNYYDSYDFMSGYAPALGNAIGDFRVSGACAKGLPTGSVQVASDGARLLSAFFYDFKGRMTETRRLLEGKRLTTTHTEYSYTDKLTKTETKEYDISGGKRFLAVSQTLENEYSTKTDRLLSTTLTVNGKKENIQRFEYDRLGSICRVTRGGDAGAVSYGHNLHGWTTGIEGKDFHEELHYTDGMGTPCYNGDISSMLWQTPDSPRKRGYTFSYDTLDRLREAVYGEGDDLSDKRNRYDEKVVEYTANGAIKRFQRRGRKDDGEYGKIDNLSVKLDGNRLLGVTDDALPANRYSSMNFIDGADERTEYTYNGVGALTSDLNRGITEIGYDNLNNPRRILFKDGTEIGYTYLPDGTKLEKSLRVAGLLPSVTYTTEYSGDVIYRNGKLDKILFQGGYCTFESGDDNPTFHYFTQDHLGNNRVVTNEDGTVEQTIHYYPFGGTFNDAGLNPELQHYKYNGKELDRTAGLNTYDYGARQYFPILPTWDRMDPLCEEDYRTSPYAYCRNNPIKLIDEDGEKVLPAHIIDNDIRTVQYYRSPHKFRSAMLQFAKTSYGKQILSDFTPKGKSIFGVNGNGKYSDFDLIIQENSFTNGNIEASTFGDTKAYTGLRMDKNNGRPYFIVSFDLEYDSNSLLETIVHEFTLHLSRYKEVLNQYNKTMNFTDASNVWNSVSEESEHRDFVKKNNKFPLPGTKNYKSTKQEIINDNPSLIHYFDETDKYYKETY